MDLPLPNDVIHKELDLIQAVVARMAQNSFHAKTWFLTGLSAIAAFGKESLFVESSTSGITAVSLSLFVLVLTWTFWRVDAFFVSTERLYREVYKWVIANRSTTSAYLYDLNTFVRESANGERSHLIKPQNSVTAVMLSKTLLPLYLPATILIVALNIRNIAVWIGNLN